LLCSDGALAVNTQTDDRIGMVLGEGRYEIIAQIGEGSMGRVYLARDRHLETEVVIKFPLSADDSVQSSDLLGRFTRETRSLVRLSHPHVVKIIDVGVHGSRPYVVLQYLSGGTLKDRVRYGPYGPIPMPPQSLRAWLIDVARALDFVHEQGHIHRDIKPANILFDGHGNAFLGDFGIVKALASDREDWDFNLQTAYGFLLGTPNYVAPELVMGLAGDGKSDQYSLAMTIHELLCGQNVMAGPSPSATLVNQTKTPTTPLFSLVPEVGPGLSDALQKALQKEPESRFSSCTAFANAVMAHVPAGSWTAIGESSFRAPGDVSGSGSGDATRQSAATPRTLWKPRRSRRTILTWVAASVMLLLAVGGGIAALFVHGRGGDEGSVRRVAARPPITPEVVAINIAYGTEKRRWLEAALAEYRATASGARARINLVGMGSVEGANAVLNGPNPTPIHVWSPASSAYRSAFERDWSVRHGSPPILRAEDLALTPMVFVMWRHRHEAFVKKYGSISFRTIGKAMQEPGGWGTIADRPEWGLFKFGHTEPAQSNSGLLTLVLMAYDFAHKARGLTPADVTAPEFTTWLTSFERGVSRHGGKLTHSTGTLMEEMVKRGPSQYDCLILYENLVIDYMKAARERWGKQGELAVVYPDPNIWNEHPYYILDVPWSGVAERKAAEDFLEFLMSEPVQRRALDHGFRPGNSSVGVDFPTSPLVANAASGLSVAVPAMCEPPHADVVTNLLGAFRRLEH
jgi:hypothetical protein